MDWQLADTVSYVAQPAAAQTQLLLSFSLFCSHFFSDASAAVVWIAVSPFRDPRGAQDGVRHVWLPGRTPHSNVLVFPGVQGGMTNCNRLKPITSAYDFFVVIKRMHNRAQLGKRHDAAGCLAHSVGVFMAVSASCTFVVLHPGSLLRGG